MFWSSEPKDHVPQNALFLEIINLQSEERVQTLLSLSGHSKDVLENEEAKKRLGYKYDL